MKITNTTEETVFAVLSLDHIVAIPPKNRRPYVELTDRDARYIVDHYGPPRRFRRHDYGIRYHEDPQTGIKAGVDTALVAAGQKPSVDWPKGDLVRFAQQKANIVDAKDEWTKNRLLDAIAAAGYQVDRVKGPEESSSEPETVRGGARAR